MAALVAGSVKGVSATAMELGTMIHDMVTSYLMWISQDVNLAPKLSDINIAKRISPMLMSAPRKKTFAEVLRCCQSSFFIRVVWIF